MRERLHFAYFPSYAIAQTPCGMKSGPARTSAPLEISRRTTFHCLTQCAAKGPWIFPPGTSKGRALCV